MRNRCVEIFFPETVDTDIFIMRSHVNNYLSSVFVASDLTSAYHQLACRAVVIDSSVTATRWWAHCRTFPEWQRRLFTSSLDPVYPRYKLMQRVIDLSRLDDLVSKEPAGAALKAILPFLGDIADNQLGVDALTTSITINNAIVGFKLGPGACCSRKLVAFLYLICNWPVLRNEVSTSSDWLALFIRSNLLRSVVQMPEDETLQTDVAGMAVSICVADIDPPTREVMRRQLLVAFVGELTVSPEECARLCTDFLTAHRKIDDLLVVTDDEMQFLVNSLNLSAGICISSNCKNMLMLPSLCRQHSMISSLQRELLDSTNCRLYLILNEDNMDQRMNTDMVKAFELMLNTIVLQRMWIIMRESEDTRLVLNTIEWNGVPSLVNQYFVAVALENGKIPPNSADLRFLSLLKKFMDTLDDMFLQIGSTAAVSDRNDVGDICCKLAELVKVEGAILLKHRDLLCTILAGNSADLLRSKHGLKWDELSVALEWLYKHTNNFNDKLIDVVNAFLNSSGVVSSQIATALNSKSRQLLRDLQMVDYGLITYFSSSVQFCNEPSTDEFYCCALRAKDAPSRILWIQAGHAAVPTKNHDWQQLRQLHCAGRIIDCGIHLPSRLDGTATEINVSSLAATCPPPHLLSSLKQDYICLLGTYYWSRTNESNVSSQSSNDNLKSVNAVQLRDLETLTDALEEKCSEVAADYFVRSIDGGEVNIKNYTDIDYSMSVVEASHGSDAFLLFSEALRLCIESETARGGELAAAASVEPYIIRSFIAVIDIVANILLVQRADLKLLRTLQRVLERLIAIIFRYSVFKCEYARELQSLLWSTEALINVLGTEGRDGTSDATLNSFHHTARSLVALLHTRMHSIANHSLSNLMRLTSFQFGSQTLYELLTAKSMHSVNLVRTVKGLRWQDAAFSGFGRLLQATRLEISLRHLDVAAAVPSVIQHGSSSKLALLGASSVSTKSTALPPRNSATIFVSEINVSRKSLLQLCRHMNFNESSSVDCRQQDTVLSYAGRVNELLLHVSDMLAVLPNCCANGTRNIILQATDLVRHRIREWYDAGCTQQTGTSLCESFSDLTDMHVHQYITDRRLQSICHSCLEPLFGTLSSNILFVDRNSRSADYILAIGKAWSLAGLIRINLLLPLLPVDPAVSPSVKASLLTRWLQYNKTGIAVDEWISLLANGKLVPEKVELIISDVLRDEEKVERLRSYAIERPLDSAPFMNLFMDMHAVCESYCRLEAVERFLIDPAHAHHNFEQLLREEIIWQESVEGFLAKLDSNYYAFTDITTPFVSAVESLSFGVRMLVTGQLFARENSCCRLGSWWKEVMQFPLSQNICVQSPTLLTASAVASVKKIVDSSETAINKVCDWIRTVKDSVPSQDVHVMDVESTVDETLVRNIVPQLVMTLSLQKLEYLIGGGTMRFTPENGLLFHEIFGQFAQLQIKREAEKVQKEAESAAFYKRKMEETVYETNEEKEEEQALRLHFPDHTAELNELLQDHHEDDDTKSLDDSLDGANKILLDSYSDDFHLTGTLIGLHCRTVFVHCRDELESSLQLWSRPHADSGFLRTHQVNEMVRRKEYLYRSCLQSSLIVAKALQKSADNLISSDLDCTSRGGSILLLATVAETARDTDAVSSVGNIHSSTKFVYVDRDLLFILDPNDHFVNDNKPINFHTDPNPREAVLACDPLKTLFTRSSQLLVMFPGNEFLLQVCKLAARINYFHVTTPVGKVQYL
jgi:hypothetical protein